MKESYRDWSSLPFEILYNIFLLARRPKSIEDLCTCDYSEEIIQLTAKLDTTFYLCNYSLVCKTWVRPAQSVMYSNVCIYKLSQLKRFFGTFEHNTSLGKMVKVLCVNECLLKMGNEIGTTKVEIIELMTSLLSRHLPNLEEFKGNGINSYTPILNALLNHHLKRLKKLTTTPNDKTERIEVENYIKCALLMKDRIESVTILKDKRYLNDAQLEQLPFHRLYDSLNQFVNITKIHIARETHEDIKALEYVAETCKSLKELTVNFRPPFNEFNLPLQNNSISNNAISKFIPRPNIKTFNSQLRMSNFKNLTYIMHKFPELHGFELRLIDNLGMIRGNRRAMIDQYTLTRLLYYLTQMDYYIIRGLTVDPTSSTETIGKYWITNSKPGQEFIQVKYSRRPEETENKLQIVKENSSTNTVLSLIYPKLNHENVDWVHRDFIERNGMYICKLLFTLNTLNIRTTATWVLPSDFMTHTLSFCPNLKYLLFSNCVLKQPLHATAGLDRRLSLQELYMDECHLYPGVLEKLSLLLCEIKQLRLGRIGSSTGNGSRSSGICYSDIKVTMPHTDINDIIFENQSYGPKLYLKVSVLEHEIQYYYRLESSKGEFEITDEEEYATGIKDSTKIHTHCAKKPNFGFEYPKYFFI